MFRNIFVGEQAVAALESVAGIVKAVTVKTKLVIDKRPGTLQNGGGIVLPGGLGNISLNG